jgi:hypothetical protein
MPQTHIKNYLIPSNEWIKRVNYIDFSNGNNEDNNKDVWK